MSFRVAMDIGGTFTDFVVYDGSNGGAVSSGKVLTTPANPAEGVLEGLQQFVAEPGGLEFLVHGTTVGLNAFLERKGTRPLLVMTAGLRDSYSIARHDRKELYALRYHKPERLVPRRDVVEVVERLRWDGSVDVPLDSRERRGAGRGVFARTASRRSRSACSTPTSTLCTSSSCVRCSWPSSPSSRSRSRTRSRASGASTSAPRPRCSTRTSRRGWSATSARSSASWRRLEVSSPLHVMQSNGGITTARSAREEPIQTLLSGPVGGTMGGAALARSTGRRNLLCIDMGGTSFDLSLVVDGEPTLSTETELEGLPVLMPLVDIHTIGAGGGSLAWFEAGGLRVGPQSAGADPGPACYGRGGTAADRDRREPVPRAARPELLPRRPHDARP